MTVTGDPVPAVDGWFAADPEPHLVGTHCRTCGTYAFPPGRTWCPNPACGSEDLEDVPLSRRGRVWSWTVNRYAPPPPYVAKDPYEPFGVVAVELPEERMVVLGQVEGDPASVAIGDEVELVLGTLYEDGSGPRQMWRWRPVGASP